MKKLLSIFLALCLLTGALTALAAEPSEAAAAEDTPQQMADALYLLGLFQGSDKGYELDRELTRVEAITLVVRMVGAEKEAMEGSYTHPFTDVPDWADPYVAYAYTKGITKGITAGTGELLFGSNDLVTGSQFLTFVLRVLGYQDANDGTGDFTWDAPYTLAETIGLAASSAEDKSFVRGGAVEIIWSALSMQMKDQTDTLADTLMEKGVFTQESLEQAQALLPSQQEGLRRRTVKGRRRDLFRE